MDILILNWTHGGTLNKHNLYTCYIINNMINDSSRYFNGFKGSITESPIYSQKNIPFDSTESGKIDKRVLYYQLGTPASTELSVSRLEELLRAQGMDLPEYPYSDDSIPQALSVVHPKYSGYVVVVDNFIAPDWEQDVTDHYELSRFSVIEYTPDSDAIEVIYDKDFSSDANKLVKSPDTSSLISIISGSDANLIDALSSMDELSQTCANNTDGDCLSTIQSVDKLRSTYYQTRLIGDNLVFIVNGTIKCSHKMIHPIDDFWAISTADVTEGPDGSLHHRDTVKEYCKQRTK